MNPFLAIAMWAPFAWLVTRLASEHVGRNAIPPLDPRLVSGGDGLPTFEIHMQPIVGGAIARVGCTWPNGHYSEWTERVQPAIGFDPFPAAAQLFVAGGGPVAGAFDVARAAKRLKGKSKAELAKMGILSRADVEAYLRRAAAIPRGLKFGDIIDAGSVVAQGLNVVAPGAGLALGAGLQGAKALAKGKPADAVKAVAKAAGGAAKAKVIATVADALKSPATAAALERVGVPSSSTRRAAHVFDGIRTAAASIAHAKRGNVEAAKAFKKAAEAHALAARMDPGEVERGGQKLFYLAIAPGA